MKAPTCRWCERKLRAYRETIIDEPAKARARIPLDALNVREKAVMPVRREGLEAEVIVTYQRTGRWGRYGDGYFCGLDCGHRFAVALLEQQS